MQNSSDQEETLIQSQGKEHHRESQTWRSGPRRGLHSHMAVQTLEDSSDWRQKELGGTWRQVVWDSGSQANYFSITPCPTCDPILLQELGGLGLGGFCMKPLSLWTCEFKA